MHDNQDNIESFASHAFKISLYCLFIMNIFLNILYPRVTTLHIIDLSISQYGSIQRIFTLILALLVITLSLMYFRRTKTIFRHVIYVFLIYFALTISNFFGYISVLPLNELVSLIVIPVIIIFSTRSKDLVSTIKGLLFLFVLVNFVFSIFTPELLFQYNYPGFFGKRLHGFARHANVLAPYSIMLVVLLVVSPFKAKYMNYTAILISLYVLILSQSKTSYIISAILFLPIISRVMRGRGLKAVTFVYLMVISVIISIFLVYKIDMNLYSLFFDNADINSLTGRDSVWYVTIEAWHNNRLFGYGSSSLWNQQMADSFFSMYGWRPGYAHNLWFQFLGSAGIIGVGSLIVFLLHILLISLDSIKDFRIISFFLVVCFFIVRGISEVPIGGSLIGDNTIIGLIIIVLVYRLRENNKEGKYENRNI